MDQLNFYFQTKNNKNKIFLNFICILIDNNKLLLILKSITIIRIVVINSYIFELLIYLFLYLQ